MKIKYLPPENSPLKSYYGAIGEVISSTSTQCTFKVKIGEEGVGIISANWENVELVEG
jgi:hypothetical protein